MGKLSPLGIKVEDNWSEHFKLASVLCPTSAKVAKCVNKYITIMERNRKLLDEGTPINHLGYRNPPIVEGQYNPDESERTLSLSSISSSFLNSSLED